MKNLRTVCVVFMTILMALCGSVFAADDVRTAITSEPIPDRFESCEKYGAITFTFQEGSTIQDGDQIFVDLAQNVNICNTQNFVLLGSIYPNPVPAVGFGTLKSYTNVATGNTVPFGAWLIKPVVNTGTFGITVRSPGLVGAGPTLGSGLYVRVQTIGTTPPGYSDNARRMAITFFDDNDPTKIDAPTNYDRSTEIYVEKNTQLSLTIFNGEKYHDPYALKDAVGNDGKYETKLQSSATGTDVFDNYLCGWYTQAYGNELINVSFDSRNIYPAVFEDDIFTFQGQREIAHKIGAQQVVMQQCYKPRDLCGYVAPGSGQTSSCSYTYWNSTKDYCPDQGTANFTKAGGNRVILQATTGSFDTQSRYMLVLEVTTSSPTGSAVVGTFFAGDPKLYAYASTAPNDLCVVPNAVGDTPITPVWNKTASNGITTGSYWPGTGCSGAAANDMIVKLSSTQFILPPATNRLIVDFGSFSYLKDIVAMAGYSANVKVTLQKAPCGTIMTGTRCVAQYLPQCAASAPTTTLLFPYTTPLDQSSGWWFGMSFCNPTSTAGEAKITVYEADGDVGTYTEPTVRAYGMVTYPDLTLLSMLTPKAGNTGTLGDDRAHIVVECKFGSAGGFGMMGNGIDSTGYSAYGNSTAWNY